MGLDKRVLHTTITPWKKRLYADSSGSYQNIPQRCQVCGQEAQAYGPSWSNERAPRPEFDMLMILLYRIGFSRISAYAAVILITM